MLQQPKTAASRSRWKRAKGFISGMCGKAIDLKHPPRPVHYGEIPTVMYREFSGKFRGQEAQPPSEPPFVVVCHYFSLSQPGGPLQSRLFKLLAQQHGTFVLAHPECPNSSCMRPPTFSGGIASLVDSKTQPVGSSRRRVRNRNRRRAGSSQVRGGNGHAKVCCIHARSGAWGSVPIAGCSCPSRRGSDCRPRVPHY